MKFNIPFLNRKKEAKAKQDLINLVKQQVEGGVEDMRNEQPQPAPQPQVQEVIIDLALINSKLNYLIGILNSIAEKEGVELKE